MEVTLLTKNIQVRVTPIYVPEQSAPERNYFYFSYSIKIKNNGSTTAQLMSRHWIITHGNGKVEEIRGPGVVGVQPVIQPGQEFEYSSFCPLTTPTGSMRGIYQMSLGDGTQIEVEVPQFYLVEPNSFH